MRWGVGAGRLLRKPTCTLWETPVCPRAGRPPCRVDHSRKNGRSLMKTNHEWTRIDPKTDGPPSTTSGTNRLLQFCALGVTMSWDEGLLGARASRPPKAWHSLGHLPHLDQPGTASWLSPPQGTQCHQKFVNCVLRGFLFSHSVFLRGPSRTPFESFPTPWSPFADPLARPLADPS